MSEAEPQQQSIQARIAALNLGQIERASIAVRPSPRPARKPPLESRRTASIPTQSIGYSQFNDIGNEPNGPGRTAILPPPTIICTGRIVSTPGENATPPKLPPRKASVPHPQLSPALPPRRPSEQLTRRDSTESMSSIVSTISSTSAFSNGTVRTSASRAPSMDGPRLRAPAYDPSNLPPLPPKRSNQEKETEGAKIMLKGAKSTPSVTTTEVLPPPRTPTLPQRPLASDQSRESEPRIPERRLPPRGIPSAPARPVPRSGSHPVNGSSSGLRHSATPPPVPLSSRPDLSKILATKPKSPLPGSFPSVPVTPLLPSCLKCRDFSGPDNHASTLPRETVPSMDWLATQLTSPFPSLTDKARAIFTWLHHNISYDVEAFFNHRVQPSTPASTLSTGLAVCEGYAGLFTAIATKAGLESIVVGGHGKGYGHSALPRGASCPPQSSNHAWNAVKIDNGEWKLLDACWGAGSVNGKGQPYNKSFTPAHFTKDNDEFGLTHFPTNRDHFFRTDGRASISWEEYFLGDQGGEPVRIFSNIAPREGLSETKFLPKHLKLPISPSAHAGPTVRFQFEKVCPHWDPVVNGPGKPYVFVLNIHNSDGREDDYVPFESNGTFWWLDVPSEKLGAKGQTILCLLVEQIEGNSARGLTKEEYLMAKGRKAMGPFPGVAAWELV